MGGIGLAIAKTLIGEENTIILTGIESMDKIKTILNDLSRRTSSNCFYYQVNLSHLTEIETLTAYCLKNFKTIDIIVNCAGVQHVSPIHCFPPHQWDHILSVNLSAVFHLTRLLLPSMTQQGWGRIINIASVHGLVASPYKAAYVAAKHGLIGLTKVIALECALKGITANAICPGWVKTPLVEKQILERSKTERKSYEEASLSLLSEKQPTLSFIKAEDIGALVLFLCSEAAKQITGAQLTIDGGWTLS